MQTALRKKTETGNEKDPSAALGMTKRGNASFHSFSTCCGSQPRLAALGSPFQGKGLAWTLPPSRGRGENAAFPILSFRAKARNLFRLRSGKGCEDSGEREAPCFPQIGRTVFHADSITKENGNGKRKRSLGCARDDETRERLFPFLFNLLRKPTPPRCARRAPSKGRGSRGHSLLPMEKATKRGWLYPRHKAFFLGCQYPFFLSTSFMSLSPWAKATKFIWRRLVSLSQKSGTMEAMCGVMMTLSICQKG